MARTLTSNSKVSPKPRSKAVRRLKFGCSLVVILTGVLAVAGTVYAKKQLDWAATVVPGLPAKMVTLSSEPSVIVSKDGVVLETISAEFRKPVKLKDVPDFVKNATLAAEDKRFFEHQGVDYWSMGRAFFSTVTGKRTEGASTITMQIAKRVFNGNSKTMDRKIKDMALATMIERQLTKEQILELYLNQVYYGSGAYGISAAAEVYFNKPLDKLTYGEAATLARCVRRPSNENPYTNKKASIKNRNVVLSIMREEGWVGEEEYQKSIKEPLVVHKQKKESSADRIAPYFCDYVKGWLKDNMPDLDLSTGGLRVETTLDLGLQKYAEKKVEEMVSRHKRLKITTSSFVLLDNEGRILAMVGGPSYEKNQFNVVTQGRRQPGSSFKPLVYATAFEYGALHPGGSVSNEPFMIRDGRGRRRPIKGGGKGGSVSIRSALAFSINTPAMWAAKEVGVENVVQLSHSAFGIQSDLPAVPTIALGADEVTPLEMAVAYSVFQSGGDRFEPFGVSKVIGPDGLPMKIVSPVFQRRQLSSTTCEAIDQCLRAVVTSGTGRAAGGITNARGKTGTTSDNKDAWFCGYTDKFIGVGWVANEIRDPNGRVRYQPMDDYVMGGHMVAPMWAEILEKAQDTYGEESRRLKGYAKSVEEDTTDQTPAEQDPGIADEKIEPIDGGQDASPDVPDGNVTPIENGDPAGGIETAKVTESTPPETNDKIVFVEICASSGQRASIYCPERIKKGFRAGKEPKTRCKEHRPGAQ